MDNISSNGYNKICKGEYQGEYLQIGGVRHFCYEDANAEDLVCIGDYKVHKDAAAAFKKMQKAAANDNCDIFLVSATRLKDYQIGIFQKNFNDKYNPTDEEMEKRIKWSAPAGFSEHHTGYALDINSLEITFKDTAEYEWLNKHAHEYGFELSFPKNNRQQVGFEPWHWRYIGTPKAQKIFKTARKYQGYI